MGVSGNKEVEYWREIITQLQKQRTIAEIAEAIHAADRSVWGWRSGRSRPVGIVAIRLYLFHMKLCQPCQGQPWHVNSSGARIASEV